MNDVCSFDYLTQALPVYLLDHGYFTFYLLNSLFAGAYESLTIILK